VTAQQKQGGWSMLPMLQHGAEIVLSNELASFWPSQICDSIVGCPLGGTPMEDQAIGWIAASLAECGSNGSKEAMTLEAGELK
jgi:hypothetical protein